MNRTAFLALPLLLIACRPSEPQIQTAIAETQSAIAATDAAQPTATEPAELTDFLPDLLTQTALPGGITPGQLRPGEGFDPEDVPVPVESFTQQLVRGTNKAGVLHVAIYGPAIEEFWSPYIAFLFREGGRNPSSIDGLGDAAWRLTDTVTYKECGGLVYIHILGVSQSALDAFARHVRGSCHYSAVKREAA